MHIFVTRQADHFGIMQPLGQATPLYDLLLADMLGEPGYKGPPGAALARMVTKPQEREVTSDSSIHG